MPELYDTMFLESSREVRRLLRSLDVVFTALEFSNFRKRFHLNEKETEYLQAKGLPVILEHAEKFVNERLAPAEPPQDGKQTPMTGHPVFVAQHGTGTCCRGCLQKWHHIPKKVELSGEQIAYVMSVIERWLRVEVSTKSEQASNI